MSKRPTPPTVVAVDDVFRRPASPDEVSRAVDTIEEAFGETHTQPSQPKSVIRELIDLLFFPEVKSMVFSLMMDPAVWKAIGDNPAVKGAVRNFVNTGKGGKRIDNMGGQSSSQKHILHWVRETLEGLIKVTQEIMALLQSFRKFLTTANTDSPLPSEHSGRRGMTTTMPDEVQRLIVLLVVILYGAIVVVRLLSCSI